MINSRLLVVGGVATALVGVGLGTGALASPPPNLGLHQSVLAPGAGGTAAEAYFGSATAASGNTVVVSADGATVNGHISQGAVYVYQRPLHGWQNTTPVAVLTNSKGQANDDFGYDVAIAGRTIVVGALDAGASAGEVDVYVEPSSGWQTTSHPTARLTVSGQGAQELGTSVAIQGSTIVSGADAWDPGAESFQGQAYVFTEPTTGWKSTTTPTATLSPNASTGFAMFGGSSAVSGTTVAVSATGRYSSQGRVYLFNAPAGGWQNWTATDHETSVLAGQQLTNEYFGTGVVFAGRTLAVGAPGAPVGSNAKQGLVYLFNEPAGGWITDVGAPPYEGTLVAPNGAAGDNLGETVASDGVTIVAGASGQANGPATGQDGGVYVFKRPGLSWHSAVPVGELRATTPVDGDYLGDHTIAVTPTLVVAGAPDHNTYKGITYLWAPLGPVLSQVAQSHSTWALGSKPPVINPSHRIRGGTTFSFKLSEPATASLVFTEKVRRHHHVRLKKKGRIRFAAKAGVSKVHVDGPISGSTKLVPGKATVRITAVNAYGATTTATLHFTVH